MSHKSRIAGYRTRDSVSLAAMMAPGVVGMTLLVLLPALTALAFAFTSWDGLSAPVWRGFGTFGEVFQNHLFWTAARNSAVFVLLAVPLRLLGALGLALLLRQRRRGIGFYRMSVFLPTVVPDVAYALIWLWIFNPLYGPLNISLKALGLAQPAWLAEGQTALFAIVIMSLFQIGEGLVVLLTGLQGIPDDYYQSASLDGANRWHKFRHITLPMLAPWLLLLTLRDIILSAQSTFTPAYLMTGGGPYYATLFMPLLMYQEAFEGLRFGHAAAIMLLLLAAVALLLVLVAGLARGWGYGEDA
ncbi:MAG: sugar ABC transporter permease [Candidatus Eisenbacteria bacterium]|nr:sugar ABC transporter permease [Candidatus Eisenbacteria bacterium]